MHAKIIMDNTRLERCIFMWDYNKGGDHWGNKISIILNSINCIHLYRNKTWCDRRLKIDLLIII